MRAEGGPVFLVDLENSVGPAGTRLDRVAARITALLTAAGPIHHALATYAAAYPRDHAGLAATLTDLGVRPIPVPPARHAAEDMLLAYAHHLHRHHGPRRILAASGDRRLAALATLGPVDLVLFHGQPAARRLLQVATTVHRAHRPDRPAPPPAHPGTTTPPRDHPHPARDTTDPADQPPHTPPDARAAQPPVPRGEGGPCLFCPGHTTDPTPRRPA